MTIINIIMISILEILSSKNISSTKYVCSILILISAPLLFSQRMLLDNSIENKNQLFELLGVKKQISQYRNIQMNDSILSGYSFQTLLIDSSGYVIKKEGFNSWSNPPKSVIEFERDKNGNIIQIFSDAKLVESKSYNDSNQVVHWCFYKADTLFNKWNFKYDHFGNQIESSVEYLSGKIDIESIKLYEYYDQTSTPKILKEINMFCGYTNIYYYDTSGRLNKNIYTDDDYKTIDSTLYLNIEPSLKDSIVEYSNNPTHKIIRKFDYKGRVDEMILYNHADSITQQMIFEYDDRGIELRDSILTENGIEIKQKPDDEMMGEQIVARMIVNGEVSFTTTMSYYQNGLIKQMIKTNFVQNSIEETNYEYEFY